MDDDEAAFFSRPKRPSPLQVQSRKRKRPNAVKREASVDVNDSSGASDSDSSTSSSRKTPSAKVDTQVRKSQSPKKVTTNDKDNPLSLSSSDEDDVPATRSKSNAKTNAPTTPPNDRRRRRSSSLTPPPQLTPRRRLAGTQLIQNVFKPARAPIISPDRSADLPPDEAELLFEEQMKAQQKPADDATAVKSPEVDTQRAEKADGVGLATLRRSETHTVEEIPDTLLEIVIGGIYVELPSTPAIIPDIKLWEKQRLFRIRLNTKLSIAKIAFCKESGMCILQDGHKLVDHLNQKKHNDIVLSYRNVRVFDYLTPHGLGISAGEQPYFEAHTKEGWAYLESNPGLRQHIHATPLAPLEPPRDTPAIEPTAESLDPPTTQDNGAAQVLKITLRSADGRELKVRTKHSSTIDAIIAGFRKTHDVPASSRIGLYFEGEELCGKLGDSEVESGDMLDVKIT